MVPLHKRQSTQSSEDREKPPQKSPNLLESKAQKLTTTKITINEKKIE